MHRPPDRTDTMTPDELFRTGRRTTDDLADDLGDAVRSCDTQLASFGGVPRFCGPVRTLRVAGDNALVRSTLATPGDGAVLVVDGGGSLHSALMGDAIAGSAVENGWAGVIVHGVVRDRVALSVLPLGVRALGSNPRKSAKEGVGEVDVPVAFGGVTFAPGDTVYADEDGIVVV